VAVTTEEPDAGPPEDPKMAGGQMSLVDHLNELRSRLIKSVIAVAVGASIVWIFYSPIFSFLLKPLEEACRNDDRICDIIVTDPLQGLATRLKVSGYGGIALAMPVLLWQLWRFIMPGLYPRERRYAAPFVVSGVFLFTLGASLAYWTMPRALQFLINIGGEDINALYTPDKYIQLITYMMLAFGAGFLFPILLVFLQLVGVLSFQRLVKWRRYAIVVIVVLVAVITPSGDPISLAALSVPMYLFYEISILIGRIITKRRATADA
jgi:sec-independent protein translocase protein TatC